MDWSIDMVSKQCLHRHLPLAGGSTAVGSGTDMVVGLGGLWGLKGLVEELGGEQV